MPWRAAAGSQSLALLVIAYAAVAAHHASAHAVSRRALSSDRAAGAVRHLHSAVSDTPAANATDVPQVHSRKCGVADVSAEQSQRVINAIAGNFELRQQVRQRVNNLSQRAALTVPRRCLFPPNATMRHAPANKVLSWQGRAAPVTVNVYFHIVQVRQLWTETSPRRVCLGCCPSCCTVHDVCKAVIAFYMSACAG